jgi:ubiquinone/menaquinone biosynthesis C-methylase UbiE
MKYTGWELHNFDQANLYRSYQFSLIKNVIKGKILEVGPGNCIYLNNYTKISNNITLIEPTKKYFNFLKKKSKKNKKINVRKNLNNLKNNYFDTIIYLDVIEHIKNDEEEIKKAHKLLKKNGTLIICVPAFQFLYSLYDKKIGHFRRYSKNDFKILLRKCQIKNFDMCYFDFIGFCLIFISNLLSKNNLKNFPLKIKLWNLLIPISRILDLILMKYFFGKSLLIKIKKN